MRYEGTRKSKADPDKDVYVFAVGIEELKALKEILKDVLHRTPETFTTSPMFHRWRNMFKRINEMLNNKDNG